MLHYCRQHALVHLRRVPILALTAYAGELARDRVMAAGLDGHLTKPLDPGMISRTIVRLVNRAPAF